MTRTRRDILEWVGAGGLTAAGAGATLWPARVATGVASGGVLASFAGVASAQGVSVDELMKPGPLPEIALGSPNAKVTIVEYASLTCGHCANFHTRTFPQLKEKYIDTGKVRFVLREFPIDPRAAVGAMLARCADGERQVAMLDLLFKQQENWAFVPASQFLPNLANLVKQAGFTQDRFDACLKDSQLYANVQATKARGETTFGVDSTPTFFVNGQKHAGALSLAEFDRILAPLVGS